MRIDYRVSVPQEVLLIKLGSEQRVKINTPLKENHHEKKQLDIIL